MAIGSEKARKQQTLLFRFFFLFERFWPLGEPPWEAPWPLGAVLGRSWGLLEHLGRAILKHLRLSHLGLTEALFLEPSRAILDALTARGAPRPGPWGGGRGRGKPLPEGGEGGVEEETP